MLKRIFEGIHWQIGQQPMMLHSGAILPLDKIARVILKKPHGGSVCTINYKNTTAQLDIPTYVRTCDDLVQWLNGKWERNDVRIVKNVQLWNDTITLDIIPS